MKCQRCGKDLGGEMKCIFCGYENVEGNVREMSREEKNFYDGVTIDTDEDYNSQKNFNDDKKNFRTNRAYINLGSSGIFSNLLGKFINAWLNNNLLAKIAVTLILIAFAALMFFIALPILFFILSLGIALYVYSKFTKKF